MPTGLDGNPDPIRTPARDAVLDHVVERILGIGTARTLVGVDGRSGTGKSTFADEVAQRLRERGRHVVRSTTDSFHRPRAERLEAGLTSAVGYYERSHQIEQIRDDALRPFAAGSPRIRSAAFDEPTDRARIVDTEVPDRSVLVFDGLFLHRPELAPLWSLSVLLEADARRDAAWLAYLLDGLPEDPTERATTIDDRLRQARWPRYRDGWAHYLRADTPEELADLRIDNNDLGNPRLR